MSLFLPLSVQALSTQTSNTIQGNPPYLLLPDGKTRLTNVDELLGFTMLKQDGSEGMEQIDASMAGTELIAPSGMKYNDVTAAVMANGIQQEIVNLTVGDDDGDASSIESTSVTGAMKVTWYDGDKIVSSSELNQSLLPCGGPYRLKVEIPESVNANTTYGDPSIMSYGTSSGVIYTFIPDDASICYLRPLDVTVNTGTEGVNIKYGSGYNSAKFTVVNDIKKGFKIDSGFPSTGFYRARFDVIGSGSDQSKYRCSSPDNGTKITLSGTASTTVGANCKVTYNSKTKSEFINGGTPTITMERNKDGSWIEIGNYTIPIPIRWPTGQGNLIFGDTEFLTSGSHFPALNACRIAVDGTAVPETTREQVLDSTDSGKAWRQKYLYRRDELTNSPYADRSKYPEFADMKFVTNYYSRDVDGTFMGEWGNLYSYGNSVWAPGNPYLRNYWTAEIYQQRGVFYLDSNSSVSGAAPTYNNVLAICRGENVLE